MYKSQFRKIDPYDWFCGPGSQMEATEIFKSEQYFKNKFLKKYFNFFLKWKTLWYNLFIEYMYLWIAIYCIFEQLNR